MRYGLQTLLVVAILLPVLGPLTDHHYAERQPHHDHVHLGPGSGEHHHRYVHPHSHDAAPEGAPATDGTVSVLVSGDRSAPNATLTLLPVKTTLDALLPPPSGAYQRLYPNGIQFQDQYLPPPPDKPPRL